MTALEEAAAEATFPAYPPSHRFTVCKGFSIWVIFLELVLHISHKMTFLSLMEVCMHQCSGDSDLWPDTAGLLSRAWEPVSHIHIPPAARYTYQCDATPIYLFAA